MIEKSLNKICKRNQDLIYKGIKLFLKDFKNQHKEYKFEGNLNDRIIIKRFVESQKDTIRFISKKRNKFKRDILSIENNINYLQKSYIELEKEREDKVRRLGLIELSNTEDNEIEFEKLNDIIEAVNEIKRIEKQEISKVKNLRKNYDEFNKTSYEEEKLVGVFLDYIKKEFLKEKGTVVTSINSGYLTDFDLILNYEYISILISDMLSLEEEIMGG
ncbi:hypothetical protein ACH36K_13000 [Clostridium sp. MB05]|jgi:hypothetical protein|uniref:hypothetical protein n=1 Tax=Clostridium sp. MB05 TaxID=3376682 RepID=UPI0039824E56